MTDDSHPIADALADNLRASSIGGFQKDNVTDALYAIARSIDRLAEAVEVLARANRRRT